MSDGESLLRAILAAPDDDAPRLVFADWLDDHGVAARAAFIRGQVALARMSAGSPDWDATLRQTQTLWRAHRRTWTAWIPEWAYYTAFHRGFLEEIRCSAADYIARADEVRLHTPLRAARLDGPAEMAVPLFRSRALDGLRELGLSVPVPDAAWEHLAACPYLGQLTALDLSSNPVRDPIRLLVDASAALPALRTLRLTWCGLGDAEAAALAGHPWAGRLRELDLSRNFIQGEGARALADSPHLEDLELLNLRRNPLTNDPQALEALLRRFGGRVQV